MRYSYSHDDEESYFGDYNSRADATAAALADAKEYGWKKMWVGENHSPMQPEDWWEANDWLEHVSCQDEYGLDCADGWENSTKTQRDELEKEVREVMAKWLDKHKLRPMFFIVQNIEEIVV